MKAEVLENRMEDHSSLRIFGDYNTKEELNRIRRDFCKMPFYSNVFKKGYIAETTFILNRKIPLWHIKNTQTN